MICLKWAPEAEGSQVGHADIYLEEYGLIVRDVRLTLALDRAFPEVIAFPSAVSVPGAGDRLIFFARAIKAIDAFQQRQAKELLAAVPTKGGLQ